MILTEETYNKFHCKGNSIWHYFNRNFNKGFMTKLVSKTLVLQNEKEIDISKH